MTAAVTLAHAQALLRAIAHVHADQILVAEERSAILTLLLGCIDDSAGDETLNALEAIFADHDDTLSETVVERFAELTNTAHVLGHSSSQPQATTKYTLSEEQALVISSLVENALTQIEDSFDPGETVSGMFALDMDPEDFDEDGEDAAGAKVDILRALSAMLPTKAPQSQEEYDAAHGLDFNEEDEEGRQQKPRVTLVGQDGNAFAVLGHCRNAANKARWTVEQWEAFRSEATAGDYDHLLRVVMTHFEVQ